MPVEGLVALEEHYLDAATAEVLHLPPPLAARMRDPGEDRLRQMDAAGIAVQVLSLPPDGLQSLPADQAVAAAWAANDRLAAVCAGRPDRFAALATLPTPDPEAAARELERCVREHGMKGAMLHGMTGGVFHDDRRFWPILQAAEAADVPIYLHPADPHPDVMARYYAPYDSDPMLPRAALGYTVEMMTAAVRMVMSGALDAHPGLRLILGHMGEGIPFLMERIDESFARPRGGRRFFRDAFLKHFTITTSGNFSTPALACAMAEMGAERIMFSVDWPFCENAAAADWFAAAPLSAADRSAIGRDNAVRLLRL